MPYLRLVIALPVEGVGTLSPRDPRAPRAHKFDFDFTARVLTFHQPTMASPSSPIEAADSPMPDTSSDADSDEQELIALGTSLIQAVLERKSAEDIKSILAAGAPTWYQDEDGWSVLHAAAQMENAEIIPMLLEEGALWNCGA